MADIQINLETEQLNRILVWLQDSGILTDYHGHYPERLVLQLGWRELEAEQPEPKVIGIQVGFA